MQIAVLFTDIVGSTRFFTSHGDLAGREMLQQHEQLVSAAVTHHGGTLVKIVGDSAMAYFLSAEEALMSAIEIQQELRRYNQKKDDRDPIHIRIAIHFGNGIIEQDDIFGSVVNIAAKLTPLVDPDQIFISGHVYKLVPISKTTPFWTEYGRKKNGWKCAVLNGKGEDTGIRLHKVNELYDIIHKRAIEQALKEGKPIPPDVLKEYPELMKEK